MEELNKNDYELVREYQQTKKDEIALYFFDKFKEDVTKIIFSKINQKFSSIPFEKGDLIHLIWYSIKETLDKYDYKKSFNGMLVKNCYYSTIREIRKFLNNSELIMNISSSLKMNSSSLINCNSRASGTNNISLEKILLEEVVDEAHKNISKFTNTKIKRIIYLKSEGYTINEISEKMKISKYLIKKLFQGVEKIVKRMYF